MKTYPQISKNIIQGLNIFAFNKIDGSNIRAEWSNKKGFYKFGSRKRLLGSDQEIILKAENLIKEKFSGNIKNIAKEQSWQRLILFFEFAGPNSFAGTHNKNDIHDIWLIDANPYKKGILPPKEFIKIFANLNIAPPLYHGPCDKEFIDKVKNSKLEGMSAEGVVCKAKNCKNNTNLPIMFKIKTNIWLEQLKKYCKGNENLYNQLV